MIIIAFSGKTSKILPRVLCRRFRHCAPIIPTPDIAGQMIMYQFIRHGKIAQITLNMRDIKILAAHGWQFVYLPGDAPNMATVRAWSCVGLSKHAARIHNRRILTPNGLYRFLTK